jgi:peptidoglycan/xylan/chitin deacetylase (PgdA/CDA1 family)
MVSASPAARSARTTPVTPAVRVVVAALAALGLALAGTARADAQTVVSLTFDDTLSSQYQIRSTLSGHAMHATFFVNSGRVDTSGYMTKTKLLALQSDGNEIAGHTVNHIDLATVDADERARQVCDDRDTLLGWGFTITNFAYPFGLNDPALEQVPPACGYDAARNNTGIGAAGPAAETIPPADRFAIRTVAEVVSTTTLADLQQAVTSAEAAGGGWVMFVFHNVCDACGTYAVSPSVLTAFLDWLQARAATGTVVGTLRDVIGGPVQPAVAGPPLPPVRSGNMVSDPGLEADANADGFPDCWRANAWGTNAATWRRLTGTNAHSGNVAERFDVTSYTSGQVRLLSQQDLGYCAATATAGHTYQLSAWYRGSLRPRLVAFYRTPAGAWNVLGQSDRKPQSNSWKQATWKAPALSSGANGIAMAVAGEAVGWLAIDDLSIIDTAP